MIYFLGILIIALLFVIIFLFNANYKIKAAHANTIDKLEDIFLSLHDKQKQLNEKVIISTEYTSNYAKDMKALGDEVVALQKVFIDIISNRNYK